MIMANNVVRLQWDPTTNNYIIENQSENVIIEPTTSALNSNEKYLNVELSPDENHFVTQDIRYKSFDDFFNELEEDIYALNLRHKDMDSFYGFFEKLLSNSRSLIENLAGAECRNAVNQVVSTATNYIMKKLRARNTIEKRRALIQKNHKFVKPLERPISLKWKSRLNAKDSIVSYKLIQTTFQWVSIERTLKSLFLDKDFADMYFEYNAKTHHEHRQNALEDFCCTETYRELDIFEDINTVQLQLGIDEFEVCDALKAKAGEQKLCGIYLEIRNLPAFCRTKINNIFLVAIIKMPDVKEGNCSFDDILKPIIEELKILESDGFVISNGRTLKAALVSVCSDNLGANYVFGFTEGFNAEFYCRMCEMPRSDCQKMCECDQRKYRNMNSYEKCLAKVNNKKINLKLTKGIKKPCMFNELKYYNIFKNMAFDVMHDILEGVIPFFLNNLFEYIVKEKVLSEAELQTKIRDFNYGVLNKCYKPKNIIIGKSFLGQNAKQILCLFLHLPFSLFEHKSKIEKFWRPMENLLQIVQIVLSTSITTSETNTLRECIKCHLLFIVNDLKKNLIPKHHFLTHYPEFITRMGPPILTWMMRMESKHKVFTDMVKRTCNFKNIAKTLALNHQERLCMTRNTFFSKKKASQRLINVTKSATYTKYQSFLHNIAKNDDIFCHTFLIIDSMQYRPGLMVIFDENMYEIEHILKIEEDFVLLCHPYIIVCYERSLNSVELAKDTDTSNCVNINLNRAEIHKTYQKIILNNKYYVIADTLKVQNLCT